MVVDNYFTDDWLLLTIGYWFLAIGYRLEVMNVYSWKE